METFSGLWEFFPWLIDSTKDISILVVLIFIIRYIIAKRLPAWWNYSLWLILLIRMLIPIQLEKLLTISNYFQLSTEIYLFSFPDMTLEVTSGWQGFIIPLERMLIFFWLIGAIVLGTYILFKNIRFWIIVKNSSPISNDKTLDLLMECKFRLNIHKEVDVIITDKVKSPALFGYFHPKLLLPVNILDKLNLKELTYVFLHELGHLKRHDIAVTWLMTVLLIIHWFNPLVWLAFYQMRIDQESACDALVLSRLMHHESVEYGNAIVVFLERYCQNRQLPSMAGILENKTQMERRLIMIANYKKYSKTMTVMATALLLAAGLILFTLTGFAQDMQNRSNNNIQNVNKSSDRGLAPESNNIVKTKSPQFPGGIEAMAKWLSTNMNYPEMAKKEGIQGLIVVEFTVDVDGKISNVTVVECPECNELLKEEAIRLLKSMPIWMPGESNGVKCIMKSTLPVRFKLD